MEAVNNDFISKLTWRPFDEQSFCIDQILAYDPINEIV